MLCKRSLIFSSAVTITLIALMQFDCVLNSVRKDWL